MDFYNLKNRIDQLYSEYGNEKEILKSPFSEEFKENKKNLEKIFREDFENLLEKVKSILNGAKILDYETEYNVYYQKYDIKIKKIEIPGGKILEYDQNQNQVGLNNVYTEHLYDPNNIEVPLIEKFKKTHFVKSIFGPK